jgi:anti-sigma regulatory factor (Ser/Thr protein kinase)
MLQSRLEIAALPGEVARVLQLVAEFCAANKLPQTACNDMTLALDEVLSNIVKYAYSSSERETIEVELAYSNNRFVATVQDCGMAFNPLQSEKPILGGDLQNRKEGGLGIFFVRSLMDTVAYERIGNRNRVTLAINVTTREVSDR